ncbi:myosin-2-like isoform X1 [Miscanthus floridulus]|uniref:myosin-2-like isoform X1 n=1 Tax=Miscanthus floridulus TaxID=154761 RepID=UPI00345A9C34
MAMSALSSLEAMLHSLMRGSGGGGGGGAGGGDDDDAPIDDTLASPPPPLPARPTPRGRHPSRPRRRVRVQVAGPSEPPPLPSSPSPSPIEEPEDARTATEDVSALVVEELERKAVEIEARLREKEEENAALRRRIESYHIRWLEYEIRTKSLEEAFHEQMAALQMAQDAARIAEETAYDRRGSSEPYTLTTAAEAEPVVRLWHGRDRLSSVGARRSAVGRLGAEFRLQSRTLDRAVERPPPGPWQPAASPAATSADDLKKLKAQFRAWAKDYKARLRRAQAEIDRDRRRRGSCWI